MALDAAAFSALRFSFAATYCITLSGSLSRNCFLRDRHMSMTHTHVHSSNTHAGTGPCLGIAPCTLHATQRTHAPAPTQRHQYIANGTCSVPYLVLLAFAFMVTPHALAAVVTRNCGTRAAHLATSFCTSTGPSLCFTRRACHNNQHEHSSLPWHPVSAASERVGL